MQIVVHDTVKLLQPLFASQLRGRELLERAQSLLYGPDGLVEALHVPIQQKGRGGYDVMQAVQQDGYDALAAQQMWGLFNPTRKPEVSEWEFRQLAEADVLGKAATWLRRFAAYLDTSSPLSRIECFILPADPANQTLMVWNHGLSCFGGVPGYIVVQLWPSPGNIARLEPALARALAHNVRWAAVPRSAEPTLADFLALEGLAAAFVALVCPQDQAEPWLAAVRQPADWDDALAWIARQYGIAAYADLVVNVYGSQATVGWERPPVAAPLAADELEYARSAIAEALAVSDPRLIAAHLYGDDLVVAQGHTGAGLPPYAGFEVAYRWVHAYLQRTGHDLRQVLAAPTDDILSSKGLN